MISDYRDWIKGIVGEVYEAEYWPKQSWDRFGTVMEFNSLKNLLCIQLISQNLCKLELGTWDFSEKTQAKGPRASLNKPLTFVQPVSLFNSPSSPSWNLLKNIQVKFSVKITTIYIS